MIPVRNLSIPNVLQAHARNIPSQECVVSPRRTATWRDFMEGCNRVANGLRALGLARGDRVALLFDNSLELLELIVGVAISGESSCR